MLSLNMFLDAQITRTHQDVSANTTEPGGCVKTGHLGDFLMRVHMRKCPNVIHYPCTGRALLSHFLILNCSLLILLSYALQPVNPYKFNW